jgi:hypothetical protein
MIGDSPWDIKSAGRAGISCVCLLTGGYSERELRDAGAAAVFASLIELRAGIGASFLAHVPGAAGETVNAEAVSDDELALLVAIGKGFGPRDSDPLGTALKTKGLVESGAGSWSLTEEGASYLSSVAS